MKSSTMSELVTLLLVLTLIWVGFFVLLKILANTETFEDAVEYLVEEYHLSMHLCYLGWETTSLNRFFSLVGRMYTFFLNVWFGVGVWIGAGLMISSVLLLSMNLWYAVSSSPLFIRPGVVEDQPAQILTPLVQCYPIPILRTLVFLIFLNYIYPYSSRYLG